jgi:hypothetical protein
MPPWIFCTTTGTPYDPANVLKAMRRALRKADLPAFRVYDLRHTFATLLLNRGVPITYVRAQLGHADPTTTLTWYAHYLPKATARYVDLLDDGAANVPSQPLAPLSADEDAEDESLTAEANEGISSAPRVIRTPDLLIRRPAGQQTQPISHDQPRKKSDDTEEK